MAEIEQRALALLALVTTDDLRLDLAGAKDRAGQGNPVAPRERIDVLLQPLKKLAVADQAILDDLGESGLILTAGQGCEYVRVSEHLARLMEGADQVLAAQMV